MQAFNLDIPTKIYFGEGTISRLPELVGHLGNNVLLTYGGGSIKQNGIYEQVVNLLPHCNIIELSGIDPNPRIETVREGVEMCRSNNIDVILAVGGGSVIDCSKVIAAGAKYAGDAWDLVADPSLIGEALPLIDILTLSATGTEMNTNAVITNFDLKEKKGTSAYSLYPYASILDPVFTYTVSAYQTAAGTADIMSHTFENYFQAEDGAFITDGVSETILRCCIKYLPVALQEPGNYEARSNLMWASTMGLNGYTSIGKGGGWSCHPIEHYLSAYYDITHAVGLAILTPRWMKHILNENTVDRFVRYAVNVWDIKEQTDKFAMAEDAIHKTYQFFKESGLPMTLPEVGIDEEYFEIIAEKVQSRVQRAYVPLDPEDVIAILNNCMTEGF